MGKNDTTIGEDMADIKNLLDQMTPPSRDPLYSKCPDCGHRIWWEKGWHGSEDEPPSRSGWFCYECDDWKD